VPTAGFLLWNIGGQPFDARLSRLLQTYPSDLLILVEPGNAAAAMTTALGTFTAVSGPCASVMVYSRLPKTKFRTILSSSRWLLLTVRQPGVAEILLAVAHLPSKREANEYDQLNAAFGLSQDIRDAEQERKHTRTLVVGDLNMNPFDPGVSMNRGLHATSTRQVAEWESRAVQRVEYPFFYNPMWGCFGDRTPGPAGTYYRAASHAVNYHWNIYDQVLFRPALMDALEELRILDHDGQESLLTGNGIPDTKSGSDHLPVYFRLNWDKIRS